MGCEFPFGVAIVLFVILVAFGLAQIFGVNPPHSMLPGGPQ